MASGDKWIMEPSTGRYRKAEAASGGAGTGINDGDWQWVTPAEYRDAVAGGGGGASAFTGLSDTPANYAGAALKVARVNAGETDLEFAAISGTGDVVGPASAVGDRVASFDGTSGKLIKDGGIAVADLATDVELAAHSGDTANPHAVSAAQAGADPAGTAAAAVVAHEAAGDPHAGYQLESEKGNASGYASLDGTGKVPDSEIPDSITRDTELSGHTGDTSNPHAVTAVQAGADPTGTAAAAVAAHEAAGDPHAGYQLESEKGSAGGYASLDVGGTVPDAQIPAAITRDSELSAHSGDTANPHGVTAAQAGADPSGTAAALIVVHEAAGDPHPIYLTEAEADLLYEALGGGGGGVDALPGCFMELGTTDISTAFATVGFDNTVLDPDANYTMAAGEVLIAAAGYYNVSYTIPINDDSTGGATRGRTYTKFQHDVGGIGTWVDVAQGKGQDYHREASGGSGVNGSAIIQVAAGDKLRLQIRSSSTVDISTEVGEATLNIHRVR